VRQPNASLAVPWSANHPGVSDDLPAEGEKISGT
jgi:hypothetical protein